MPPHPRLCGEGQAESHHYAARQEETPRAEPTRHPADGRTQASVDEDQERKGAGDQRPAPAERLDQRHQEDRVGVPRAVDYHQGDEGGRDHQPPARVLGFLDCAGHPVRSLAFRSTVGQWELVSGSFRIGGGFGRRGATTQRSAHEKQVNATAPHMATA